MSKNKAQVTDGFTPIVSSNLAEGRYETKTRQLDLRFKSTPAGEAFRYKVMPGLAKKFMATWDGTKGSAGSFFAQKIKGLAFEKVDI